MLSTQQQRAADHGLGTKVLASLAAAQDDGVGTRQRRAQVAGMNG
jgi:hypothetical protein